MQLETVIARAFRGRWTHVFAGVVAAAVLLPVPALATFAWLQPTWNLTWTESTQTGLNPPPDPRPTFMGGTAFDSPGGTFVQFSMGNYNPPPGTNGKSELQAIRDFQTDDAMSAMLVQHFLTTLQNANLHVSVTIMPLFSGGTNNWNNPNISESAGFNQQTFDIMQTYANSLKADPYRIIIDVSYAQAAQNPSFWSNSFHRFTFSGL
jgi:hypothetical protein